MSVRERSTRFREPTPDPLQRPTVGRRCGGEETTPKDLVVGPPCVSQSLTAGVRQDCIELAAIPCIRLPSDKPVTLEAGDEVGHARRAQHDAVCERGHADALVLCVEEGDEDVELRDGKTVLPPQGCVEVREYPPIQ